MSGDLVIPTLAEIEASMIDRRAKKYGGPGKPSGRKDSERERIRNQGRKRTGRINPNKKRQPVGRFTPLASKPQTRPVFIVTASRGRGSYRGLEVITSHGECFDTKSPIGTRKLLAKMAAWNAVIYNTQSSFILMDATERHEWRRVLWNGKLAYSLHKPTDCKVFPLAHTIDGKPDGSLMAFFHIIEDMGIEAGSAITIAKSLWRFTLENPDIFYDVEKCHQRSVWFSVDRMS